MEAPTKPKRKPAVISKPPRWLVEHARAVADMIAALKRRNAKAKGKP